MTQINGSRAPRRHSETVAMPMPGGMTQMPTDRSDRTSEDDDPHALRTPNDICRTGCDLALHMFVLNRG
ncbi:hypothetical protein [Burkholderia pyrrocinia]|uniref:hypothetical protein n=1 Tax=Burkholderia pyrrocinia TaxID=60550 RepID=UPI0030CA6AA7